MLKIYLTVQVLQATVPLLTILRNFGCPEIGFTCPVLVTYVFLKTIGSASPTTIGHYGLSVQCNGRKPY